MIRVVAALIERKGKLLICRRRRGGILELQWEFPGGKLRAGETPRAGLVRELREELAISARIGREIYRTRYRYPELGSAVQIVFFAVRETLGRPRNLVFEQIAWAHPDELSKYDFLPADRELVTKIARKELLRPTSPESPRSRSRLAWPKT